LSFSSFSRMTHALLGFVPLFQVSGIRGQVSGIYGDVR